MTLLTVSFARLVGAVLTRDLAPRALGALGPPCAWDLAVMMLWMAAVGMLGSMILRIPGAHALYACRFPGRRTLRAVASVPFVLPTVVVDVVFRFLPGEDGAYSFLKLDGTKTAVIVMMAFFNFFVTVWAAGTIWASLGPRPVDAARILGAGPVQVFHTVTLLAIAPATVGVASLIFLFCSTTYEIVMTPDGVSTLESEMWARVSRPNSDVATGLSLVQFVIVALVPVISSWFSRSAALRITCRRRGLRLADAPAVVLTAVMILALILAPMASLIAHSLVHADVWSLENCRQLTTSGSGLTGDVTVIEALGNSLRTAAYMTLVVLVVGAPLAFALLRPVRTRRARLGRSLAEAFVMTPLGASSVMVGFDFPISLRGPPLELGGEVMSFAQAIVIVSMALRALLPVLCTIGPCLREVIATLGADPVRILRTIDLPLAAKGPMLITSFVLAISLGESDASNFLVNGENDTLPVLISRLPNRLDITNYGMAFAASVILGLLTTFVMLLYELSAGPDARIPAAEKAAEAAPTERRSAESKVEESKTMARIEELK